jgi:hypothetical protein
MKHLSKAAENTVHSVSKAVTTTSTPLPGLIKEAGKLTGQVKPAQRLISHKEGPVHVKAQAALIKSVMRAKKPKKCYADNPRRQINQKGEPEYYRQYHWDVPDVTDEERHIIEQSRLACPQDTIIDLITRYLEIHKKHIVDGEEKRLILYTDMAMLLYGLPEYALTLGILDMVNDRSMVWFPNVGQIREAAEAHVLPWPDNLEPGEDPYAN